MVRTSPSLPRAQGQSLIGELRSHTLDGMSQQVRGEIIYFYTLRSEQSENEIKK